MPGTRQQFFKEEPRCAIRPRPSATPSLPRSPTLHATSCRVRGQRSENSYGFVDLSHGQQQFSIVDFFEVGCWLAAGRIEAKCGEQIAVTVSSQTFRQGSLFRGFEWQVVHDMGHLLGEHDTNPTGEIEQAAFEAGYMRRDPFFLIFSTTMIFHLGFPVLGDDYVGTAKGAFDPGRATRAYERGLGCNTDLTEWDYWQHVDKPIADVRRELNILPR